MHPSMILLTLQLYTHTYSLTCPQCCCSPSSCSLTQVLHCSPSQLLIVWMPSEGHDARFTISLLCESRWKWIVLFTFHLIQLALYSQHYILWEIKHSWYSMEKIHTNSILPSLSHFISYLGRLSKVWIELRRDLSRNNHIPNDRDNDVMWQEPRIIKNVFCRMKNNAICSIIHAALTALRCC